MLVPGGEKAHPRQFSLLESGGRVGVEKSNGSHFRGFLQCVGFWDPSCLESMLRASRLLQASPTELRGLLFICNV